MFFWLYRCWHDISSALQILQYFYYSKFLNIFNFRHYIWILICILFGRDEKSHQRISLNRWFYDERWSKNRCVTSLDWSPQYPELLLASYNNNEESPNDPDGVVLVWNTKFKKTTPEYIFHCQSAVMSATFARFHPYLILGGTYSGQIVLWDNRVQKRTPIQRTPLSASAHTVNVCMLYS